jgi:hypothetical protein
MGRKGKGPRGNSGGGGGGKRRPVRTPPPDAPLHNFLPEAGAGCHVAHFDAPWIVGLDACVPAAPLQRALAYIAR